MTVASFTQSKRPRPSIYLSDETVRVRDALIDKFIDKPLEELNEFISMALETEQDEFKRLGVLAARVYILRMRISNVSAFNNDPTMTEIPSLTSRDLVGNRAPPLEADDGGNDDTDFDPDNFEEWTELRITEDGEINGVRFSKDAVITVGPFDAYRLLKTEKAAHLTPPETTDESNTIVVEEKNEEQLEQEIDTLSSDNNDINAISDADLQEADMADPASAADAPPIEDDASDDDTKDDSADKEEGVDPLANR